MVIKQKSISKLFLWSFVFITILLNIVFAINKRLNNSISVSDTKALHIMLTSSNSGNVTIEENKHFKKYVISCDKEIKKLQWEDKKSSFDIYLNKSEVSNLKIKADKQLEDKDIYYSNTKDGFKISINKYFNENNSVFLDKNNNKNINIFISKEDAPYSHVVVLDAGHGGVDKGANFGNTYEKDINLKIANYAAIELQFKGFKVIQTRDTDELLKLKEVGDITNASSADIFVSVHINENKENKYKGVTSYYYDPNGFQKQERIKLAKDIQKELIKSDEWYDRGVLRQNFAVLRYSKIPAVLLECGFLSNAEDRGKLNQDIVLRNLAHNITDGIINYFDNEEKNN